MKFRAATIVIAASFSSGALGQEFESIGSYQTTLGVVDMSNSSGVQLNDFCAIVQQDRANWHRFGRANAGDQGDRFFNTPAMRSLIGANCDVAQNSGSLVRDVLSGTPRRIGVDIQGWGARVDYVFIWALD